MTPAVVGWFVRGLRISRGPNEIRVGSSGRVCAEDPLKAALIAVDLQDSIGGRRLAISGDVVELEVRAEDNPLAEWQKFRVQCGIHPFYELAGGRLPPGADTRA